MSDAPSPVQARQTGGQEAPGQKTSGRAHARWLWIVAAGIGVVGAGLNCLDALSSTHAADEFAAAVGQAALLSAVFGLFVAVVLATAWTALAIAFGRGWTPARWPLGVLGVVGIAVDSQNLAGGWIVLITAVAQIVAIALALVITMWPSRAS